MLQWSPQDELPSTIAEPILEQMPLTPPSTEWTSMSTYAYEPLVEECDAYLTEVEQGIISIEDFSMETIQAPYDRLLFEDEKEALRYRIEALTYLQTLETRLSTKETLTTEEWNSVYQKVKHLVPSKLRNSYVKRLEEIKPTTSMEVVQEGQTIDHQLSELHGERYQNLPGPLRQWLKQLADANPTKVEEVSVEGLDRLDDDWERLLSTQTVEEWWNNLQAIVLTDEINQIGSEEDWKALFAQPLPFTRWDLLLQAGRNQVSLSKRLEQEAIEKEGYAETLPLSSLSTVIQKK